MNQPVATILWGDGINCEEETAIAAQDAGFDVRLLHTRRLKSEGEKLLFESALFVLPGGFSSEMNWGRAECLRTNYDPQWGPLLFEYIDRGGLVLGICNGFQALVQLGVFGPEVFLAHNAGGQFLSQWVPLEIQHGCVFTDPTLERGANVILLPIRHGEGRLVRVKSHVVKAKRASENKIVLKYLEDINGSFERCAGLSSASGRVLGLMPHPEAYWSHEQCPASVEMLEKIGLGRGAQFLGYEFFTNAYEACTKHSAKQGRP